MLLMSLIVFFDFVAGPDGKRNSLMNAFRLDIENTLHACRGSAPRLFCHHGEGSAFVKQSQFTVGPFVVFRVIVDAAPVQNLVQVGHQGTGITQGVLALFSVCHGICELFYRLAPLGVVAEIGTNELSSLGHSKVIVVENELPDLFIEHKAVQPVTGGT